jgi:hypothetical protein
VLQEQMVMEVIGAGLAAVQGDPDGVRARLDEASSDPRAFAIAAVATIQTLARDLGRATGQNPADVLGKLPPLKVMVALGELGLADTEQDG